MVEVFDNRKLKQGSISKDLRRPEYRKFLFYVAGIARFQPMNFPPFPSMDFMQVPSFPSFPPFMSPPNNPVVNPPLSNPSPNYPPANYPPFSEQQRPNPQEPEPNKVNSGGNPWSVFEGTKNHKKIKVECLFSI